ncbi:MAG: CGNR zinc finger domain-containing protein [Pseudonocardiaceae bacterium]|nr:CGNR zinc finger domain-containing protein [Pseudonocardiaceae bacterium]
MHFNHYGGTGAELAVRMVNAPVVSDDLLRAHELRVGGLSQAQCRTLTEWAGRLRPVFTEPELDTVVKLVNELLADSASKPYISQHDGRPPHLHYASEHDDAVARVLAFTAAGLANLVCEAPQRLGHCGRSGCDVVYVGTSRNGRRRFCSTRCANRTRVSEHRGRRRAEG